MNFELNKKYTIFGIGEMLPASFRSEIICKGFIGDRPYFINKGKRKKFHLRTPLAPEALAFEGHDILPKMKCEASNSFIMNGKYHFYTDDASAVEALISKNLNENFSRPEVITYGIAEEGKRFVSAAELATAEIPEVQKLTTGEQNLLNEFKLNALKQDAPRLITLNNRFSGESAKVNELEAGIYKESMNIYRQYEREAEKGGPITAPVAKADRLKYLLVKLNIGAYQTLLD